MNSLAFLDRAESNIAGILGKTASHAFEQRYIQQQAVNGLFTHD